DHRVKVDLVFVDRQLFHLEQCPVEEVVDQCFRVIELDAQFFCEMRKFFGLQMFLFCEIEDTRKGIHRRTKVVRDDGEEFVFHLVQLLQFDTPFFDLRLVLHQKLVDADTALATSIDREQQHGTQCHHDNHNVEKKLLSLHGILLLCL